MWDTFRSSMCQMTVNCLLFTILLTTHRSYGFILNPLALRCSSALNWIGGHFLITHRELFSLIHTAQACHFPPPKCIYSIILGWWISLSVQCRPWVSLSHYLFWNFGHVGRPPAHPLHHPLSLMSINCWCYKNTLHHTVGEVTSSFLCSFSVVWHWWTDDP